jgi:DNA-binding PadR family transcriptional regulator
VIAAEAERRGVRVPRTAARALPRLVAAGYASAAGPGPVAYRITERGKLALAKALGRWAEGEHAAPVERG